MSSCCCQNIPTTRWCSTPDVLSLISYWQPAVRVFELQNTMPHAKTFTVDGIFSTLGSANMDQRSFSLNFEANLFFYGAEVASELERDFLALCAEAREVTAVNRAEYFPSPTAR